MPNTQQPASAPPTKAIGQHDFRFFPAANRGESTKQRGMYCSVCGAKQNSERGQQPCRGKAG